MEAPTLKEKQIKLWHDRLRNAKYLGQVESICMDISAKAGSRRVLNNGNGVDPTQEISYADLRFHNNTFHSLLMDLFDFVHPEAIPYTKRKQISTALISLCTNVFYCDGESCKCIGEHIKEATTAREYNATKSIIVYGMIYSKFSEDRGLLMLHNRVESVLHKLFLTPGLGYTCYFHTVAQCLFTTYQRKEEITVLSKFSFDSIWLVALVNLESANRGVREIILNFLHLLMKDNPYIFSMCIRTAEKWHWMNRNKYFLLATIFRARKFQNVLDHSSITHNEIENAVVQSLRYKYLINGGQAILREIPTDRVHHMVEKVLETETDDVVRCMAKYWFTSISTEYIGDLFLHLKLDQLKSEENVFCTDIINNKKERLLLIMNMFQRELKKQPSIFDILQMLCSKVGNMEPQSSNTMGLLITTLTYHVLEWRFDPTDQFFLLDILLDKIRITIDTFDDIELGKTLVTQCSLLLRKSSSSSKEKWLAVPKFLHSMYNRYLSPCQERTLPYYRMLTALRLFGLLVEQCFVFPSIDDYEMVARPPASVSWLASIRPFSASPATLLRHFHDEVLALNHLFHNENEAVRYEVARLLYNQKAPYCLDASLLANLTFCATYMPENYPRLLAAAEREVLEATKNVHLDLHACVVREKEQHALQLHQTIERTCHVCFGIPKLLETLETIEPFFAVVEAVNSAVEVVMGCLNFARPMSARKTRNARLPSVTSRDIMDRSMVMLLERSPKWTTRLDGNDPTLDTQIDQSIRAMQEVLWKTLRVVSVFNEQYCYWLLKHLNQLSLWVPDAGDPGKGLRECLVSIGTVLLTCCHRGTIESSAIRLGRMVRQIVYPMAQNPGVLHVESLFREALALKSRSDMDFRRNRGYLLLLHHMMQEEADRGVLLRYYLQDHIQLDKRAKNITGNVRSGPKLRIIDLHQLNLLICSATLHNVMLPYLDKITVVILKAYSTFDWPTRTVAGLLFMSCLKKLAGQQQQHTDIQYNWSPVYVSLDEALYQMPLTAQYMLKMLMKLIKIWDIEHRDWSTTSLSLILKFISQFEYREYGLEQQDLMILNIKVCAFKLLGHDNTNIRHLAALCYVQLYTINLCDAPNKFLDTIDQMLDTLFSRTRCSNFQHGMAITIFYMVRRYNTLYHFAQNRVTETERTLASIRGLVKHHARMNPDRSTSYFYRKTMLYFLIYIGFERTDPLLITLLHDAPVTCIFGEHEFRAAWNRVTSNDNGGDNFTDLYTMPYEILLEPDHEN